jgi:hypothetical protein
MNHRPAGDHGTAVAVTQPGGVGTPFNAASPPETLAAGSHTIVAVYRGDSDDTGSQGSLTCVVDQAAQTITTTSTPVYHSAGRRHLPADGDGRRLR